ncbi:GNAT family N-acetyltransferase [Alkalicoccobacillus murimartini]|uniref:GNAT family N-acetyltransferase n=1 Tax=Alkalicoccobacillus murimartini TaxID=171685 RepID=UPI0027D89F25|nr:GNAT family N-acetyltransferase [Alkalicoccobacillus murimartini]
MTYKQTTDQITTDMLEGFFDGWPSPPSTDKHLELLQKSSHITLAIDENTQQVVGYITAISDQVLSAYIPLLEVLPDYKNNGIGSELIHNLLDQLKGLYMIDLLCDAPLQEYYKKFGMQPVSGMCIRNYSKQNGE